jgi:hypothetical protein
MVTAAVRIGFASLALNATPSTLKCKKNRERTSIPLDSKGELDTNIDLTGHLDNLGELDGLLGGVLEVLDGEDLQAGLVDLGKELC